MYISKTASFSRAFDNKIRQKLFFGKANNHDV